MLEAPEIDVGRPDRTEIVVHHHYFAVKHSPIEEIDLYASQQTFLHVTARCICQDGRIATSGHHHPHIHSRQRCSLQTLQQTLRRQEIRCLHVYPLLRIAYSLQQQIRNIAPFARRTARKQIHSGIAWIFLSAVARISRGHTLLYQLLPHKSPVDRKAVLKGAYSRPLYAKMSVAP